MTNEEYPILSSASQIKATVGRQLVAEPSWQARVWVYELTGRELDEYRQPMYKSKAGSVELSLKESNLRLLVLALRDENGNRLYPNTARGILELGDLPSAGTERLGTIARELSGLAGTDADDAEDEDGDEGEAGEAGNSDGSAASPNGGRRTSSSSFDSLVISGAHTENS